MSQATRRGASAIAVVLAAAGTAASPALAATAHGKHPIHPGVTRPLGKHPIHPGAIRPLGKHPIHPGGALPMGKHPIHPG